MKDEKIKKVKQETVTATLTKVGTYHYKDVLYVKDSPTPVDVITARELKITGLFKFSKDEE